MRSGPFAGRTKESDGDFALIWAAYRESALACGFTVGSRTVRALEVDGPGGNLSLQNVTITGGSADIGGGIENVGGTLTLLKAWRSRFRQRQPRD